MTESFRLQHCLREPPTRQAVLELLWAIEELLLIPMADPTLFMDSWDGVQDEMVSAATPFLSKNNWALVRALVSHNVRDGREAMHAFLHDMAEILFLPREARSEYRDLNGRRPPYLIHKLLLEYALLSRHLDRLMDRLNKAFCVTDCPMPPLGCCHLLGYDLGLVPDRMLTVQALEATLRGWSLPAHPDRRACRYHTPSGCALRLFKTPACIGAMCGAVERDLDNRYPAAPLARFRGALSRFRNSDIDRKQVFKAMADVIEEGERLLGEPIRMTHRKKDVT